MNEKLVTASTHVVELSIATADGDRAAAAVAELLERAGDLAVEIDRGAGGGTWEVELATDEPEAVENLARRVVAAEFGLIIDNLVTCTRAEYEDGGPAADAGEAAAAEAEGPAAMAAGGESAEFAGALAAMAEETDADARDRYEALRERTLILQRLAYAFDHTGLSVLRGHIGRLSVTHLKTFSAMCGAPGLLLSPNQITTGMADYFAFNFDDGNRLDDLYALDEEDWDAVAELAYYLLKEVRRG